MTSFALLVLPVLGLVAGIVVALVTRPVVTVGINEHAEVVRLYRRHRVFATAGVVLGFVVATPAFVGALERPVATIFGHSMGGRTQVLAPTFFGVIVIIACLLAAQFTPTTARRSALLRTRRVRDIVATSQWVLPGLGLTLVVALLGIGVALGVPGGRHRESQFIQMAPSQTASFGWCGPWPGTFYALPLAGGVLVGLVIAGIALTRIVRRARPSAVSAGLDDLIRRWAARSVLNALDILLFGTIAPVATIMAISGGACAQRFAPGWMLPITITAMLVTVWSLVSLVIGPRLRVDDLPPAHGSAPDPIGVPAR